MQVLPPQRFCYFPFECFFQFSVDFQGFSCHSDFGDFFFHHVVYPDYPDLSGRFLNSFGFSDFSLLKGFSEYERR